MDPAKENLSAFLTDYACLVWERIRFARNCGQRISETTITENLIFDFWYHAKKDDLPMEIYEAKDEQRNGNDLELFVETQHGFILMVCQAKLIREGKYPNISHKTGGKYQIDSLLAYGKALKGQSCYLLYNYLNDFSQNGFGAEYGVTCCTAEKIKKDFFKDRLKIPKFRDIHPEHAFPLAKMITMINNEVTSEVLHILDGNIKEVPFKFYTADEVRDLYPWEPIIPPGRISGLPAFEEEVAFVAPEPISEGFRPKYRIVFPFEKIKYGLWRVT